VSGLTIEFIQKARLNSFLRRRLLQAPYHCYTGFFTQGAATHTGAQAQYRQTNEDGILEGDVQ